MPTSDQDLSRLSFPAQYLEAGVAMTRALGADVEAYYRHCGVALFDPSLPGQTINGCQLRRSDEWLLSICPPGIPPLAIFLPHSPVTIHGPIGMLAITAGTLGDALEGLLRYFLLVMPAYTLRRHDLADQVHLIFEARVDFGPSHNFVTETVVTAILKISPFLARQPEPLPVVHFTHAPMGNIEDYEQALGCSLVFSSSQNKLVIAKSVLDIPLLAPSLASHHMMQLTLEEQSRSHILDTQPVTREVRQRLKEAMRDRRALDAGMLADRMALSERTLSRRLHEEGITLPRLRTEVGCEYAETLLLETSKSIAQIADITGFKDAAAFARAFRRCRGRTPSAVRGGTVALAASPKTP